MPELYVPHDWLWSCLSERRKVPDKGAAESGRIAPTHLPVEHCLPHILLRNSNKRVFTPVLPRQDARWQRAGDQTRDFKSAHADFLHFCLAFISSTSPRETAGVLLNTLVRELLIPGKRLRH